MLQVVAGYRGSSRPNVENLIAKLLENMVVLIFLALGLGLAIASPLFLTPDNLLNVLRQAAVLVIISVAFTLVLGSGQFDLSVGAVMGLCGVLVGKMMTAGISPPLAVALGVAIGVVCGFFNAAMVTMFNLNPLITTIATALIFRGTTNLVTNGRPVSGLPPGFVTFGQGSFLGVPFPVFVMFATVLAMYVLINRTVFGRQAIAVGGNSEAAAVTGISLARVRFACYGLVAAAAALAGAVQTARSASAQVSAGVGIEFDAIAAVVIGGTSLWGGNARVFGTLFGCLIVGMIDNGLNLLAVNPSWQTVAKGVLILLAITFDSVSLRIISRVANRRRTAVDTGATLAANSAATSGSMSDGTAREDEAVLDPNPSTPPAATGGSGRGQAT